MFGGACALPSTHLSTALPTTAGKLATPLTGTIRKVKVVTGFRQKKSLKNSLYLYLVCVQRSTVRPLQTHVNYQ